MRKATAILSWFISGNTLFSVLAPQPSSAQIIPDTTLRINSKVTVDGNISTITEGTQVGNNLFHSFAQFSLPTGGQVHFNNSENIHNILIRVTGQSISTIDGLIQSNGIANLFLINPNGISFGSNAQLNIGGSFIGSTASSIKFTDGTYFEAKPSPTESLLTVSIPAELKFSNNPGSIHVFGDGQGARTSSDLIDTMSGLHIQPNQTLALVGGDLTLKGATLKTAGGQITLGSVAGVGFVSLTSTDKGWLLGYSGIKTFGDIRLSQGAVVDASGVGGGDIEIQSQNLSMDSGSQLEASTLGSQSGGTIRINASDSVSLAGTPGSDLFLNTSIAAEVYEEATGTGGNIIINTGRLSVTNEGQVSAGTSGIGNAGFIEISARAVEVVGKSIPTDSPFGSSIASVVEPGATGSGGDININTERLTIRDGGAVSVSTYSQGNGGNLTIKATDSTELSGKLPGDGTLSSSRISALTWGSGKAGNVSIETGKLTLQDEAKISVSSEEPTVDIGIENAGTGNAGNLQINANKIGLANKSSITAATSGSEGGNILLRSGDLLLHNSTITTNTLNNGNSGNITIDVDTLVLQNNSSVTANAFEGRGGNIEINAQGFFLSSDSKVTATSEKGVNGTVKINTSQVNFILSGITPSSFNPTKISNTCYPENSRLNSNLSITGKGGIPQGYSDLFTNTLGWTDQSMPIPAKQLDQAIQTDETQNIVVAQGWKDNGDGTVSFTITPDHTEDITAYSFPLKSSCPSST
ncbi:MAG: filamentous hemagglutinin N-terminal domain-containing protein [Gloeotrichia echinulata DEX184]|nr:filamentous hemagglutinin N-terminal domain-containing protein [Gloeotrichia echinulata DEX184]